MLWRLLQLLADRKRLEERQAKLAGAEAAFNERDKELAGRAHELKTALAVGLQGWPLQHA